MSVTLAHPFRLDANGQAAALDAGSSRHAAQLAGHALSTAPGERGLAPGFGLTDLAGGQVDPAQIHSALAVCTPELAVETVTVNQTADGHVDVTVTVDWDLEED